MRALSGNLIVLVAVWSFAACSGSSSSSSGQNSLTLTPTISATAAEGTGTVPNAVKANGTNVVTINVSGATKAPITVKTPLGTFVGGTDVININGLSGSVVLTTCDARTDSACTGAVKVTAVDSNGAVGSVTLTFIGYETICNDGSDNNGNGLIDCADPDCDQKVCSLNGTAGTCQSLVCVLPTCVPTNSTEICNNGVDDNCNGLIDCQESSCDGQNCKSGYVTFVCQSGVCTDLSSGYGLTVVPKRTRLPADGQATTTVTVTVTKTSTPQAGASLTLTTNFGAFVVGGSPVASTVVATGADGTATVTFQASATAGTATITAALTAVPQVSLTTLVTMPALGSIQIGVIQNPVMGVKYSGWNEQNQISVLLLDTQQKPYPDGLNVRFEHQQLGGSTISTPWTPDTGTCLQANYCLGYLGQTTSPAGAPDTQGMAYVNLYSGTAAGLVAIKVTATAGGITSNYTIQNIAIVGAKASGAHISLECGPKNIPALAFDHDCVNTYYSGPESPIQCKAYFADRFNNVLGRAILATFSSEAGAAGPPAFTAQYDPTKSEDQTANLGFASDTVSVTGYKLPEEVAPIAGEPSVPTSECGASTHNPRDGLNTIIVMAKGEEGFIDLNGNGVWDLGEPYIDQGEPFIDANDNGVYDSGEYFVDLNNNGKYDGPNGQWDADTTIWAETRVLYTGSPVFGPKFSVVTPASVLVLSSANKQTATTVVVDFVLRMRT